MLKNIIVTGAGGQIAYSLLFALCRGDLIQTPFCLKLLETPEGLAALEGVKMELEDTSSSFCRKIEIYSDPEKAFDGGDYFFFIGAFPRGPGMERRDLLEKNGQIFKKQGHALKKAAQGAKVLVVGNPCNTNALILKKVSRRADILITSMSMLDHLRAQSFIASHIGAFPEDVENLIIWGNHSKSLYVDTHHATVSQKPLHELLVKKGLEEALQTHTQKRGEIVIAKRGKSSAGSAAHAALRSMKALIKPSYHFFSCGVYTAGNPYGIDEDLFFSMPCILDASGNLKVVEHFDIHQYRQAFEPSIQELVEERKAIMELVL